MKSFMKKVLLVAIIVAGYFGFKMIAGEGAARIVSMTPGGMMGNCHCWVTFKFGKPPEGINTKDVRFVFEGAPMTRTAEFGWDFITGHAQMKGPGPRGRVPANLSAANAPPVGTEFDVDFPLDVKMSMKSDESFDVTATLYWGGRKQDSALGALRYLYGAR